MKLEGWIAIINEGWIGTESKEELTLLTKKYGSSWPVYKITITLKTEATGTITIPPSGEEVTK